MKNPRSILITGASSGIGKALAETYATEGVYLFLSGRNTERLEETSAICRKKGAGVSAELIDVTDKEAMAVWIKDSDKARSLDLVIANAGISGGTGGAGESTEQTRTIFDVNVNGVINTVLPAIDQMKARGKGQIAIMSSLAAYRGLPSAPAYSASKAAVKSWGEALRGLLAKDGIKVNVICPGFVKSRITDANDFHMPFFMETDKAAKIIKKGLRWNIGRITFPLPMALIGWLIGAIPSFIIEPLINRLPKKPSN